MSSIDSTAFYLSLSSNLTAAKEEILLATDETVYFHIHLMPSYKGPSIGLSNGKYGIEKIEVEGVSLVDLVAEFIRRARFTTLQANLQIGPPIVEQAPVPRRTDDEIPF